MRQLTVLNVRFGVISGHGSFDSGASALRPKADINCDCRDVC